MHANKMVYGFLRAVYLSQKNAHLAHKYAP